MIVDLYDAIDVMVTALLAWIAIGAAIAVGLGYTLAALVWCACRAVCRGVSAAMAWRGLRKPQAPAGAPQTLADGFRDAGDAPDAPQGPSNPAPPLEQTVRKAA